MSSYDEIKSRLAQAASAIDGLAVDQKRNGVSELLSVLDRVPLPPQEKPKQADLSGRVGLILFHSNYGGVSVKYSNYFISWRKLLLTGGAIPASYLSSTLSAMTILVFLAKGAVHVFDGIDAKILALVHKNNKILPIATGVFYDRFAGDFPPEINKDLFMIRVVKLSGCGAISIDNDLLKITEPIYSFD